MFYLIPIVLGICSVLVLALFVCLLVFYLKKLNSEKVCFYVNGKKVKTSFYNKVENIKFPKLNQDITWYFDPEQTIKYNIDDITTPVFNLYTTVKEEQKEIPKPEEVVSEEKLPEAPVVDDKPMATENNSDKGDKPVEKQVETKKEQPKEVKNVVSSVSPKQKPPVKPKTIPVPPKAPSASNATPVPPKVPAATGTTVVQPKPPKPPVPPKKPTPPPKPPVKK